MKSTSRKTSAVTLGIVLAGAAFTLPPALAAEPGASATATNDARFASLDTNHDGMLSRAEVHGIRGYESAFKQADENRDGKLSPDEFVKAESIYTREEAARYVDDTLVTAKVKAALVKELKLESTDVSVKTEAGQVLLSGFVDDAAQRDKAVQTASKVAGVLAVRNGLVIR